MVKDYFPVSRLAIECTFVVGADGYIVSEGMFKGERIFIPHFWHAYECCEPYTNVARSGTAEMWAMFAVTDARIKEFPELAHVSSVGVRRASGGMVESWVQSAYRRRASDNR